MNRRSFLITFPTIGLGVGAHSAFAAGIKPYDAKTFANALNAGPVVVHVHADWCPVCKAQQPTLEKLSTDAKLSKVEFVKVNFDKDKDFLKAHRVANQSVIVVFKGGKEVARLSGLTDPILISDGVLKAL